MYFWKIDKLKKDLAKQPLSESESFKYLFATIILYSLAMIPFPENNLWDVIDSLIGGVITVFGVWYIYKCNRGSMGSNFLQKYLSIGWVVGIRWLVFVLLPTVIVYFIAKGIYYGITAETYADIADIPENTTLSDVLVLNLLFITYFWLFGKHIKDTVKNEFLTDNLKNEIHP